MGLSGSIRAYIEVSCSKLGMTGFRIVGGKARKVRPVSNMPMYG